MRVSLRVRKRLGIVQDNRRGLIFESVEITGLKGKFTGAVGVEGPFWMRKWSGGFCLSLVRVFVGLSMAVKG